MHLHALNRSSTASAAPIGGSAGAGVGGGGIVRRCSASAAVVARRRRGATIGAATNADTPSTTPSASESADVNGVSSPNVTRRRALLSSAAATIAAVAAAAPPAALAAAADDQTTPSSYYTDDRQAYRIQPPSGWELKQKAGADALWEDPARRSSSLGVTVAPVRVPSLAVFGPLETVGTRLLDAERRKESTKSVTMLRQEERVVGGGDGGGGASSSSSSSSSAPAPLRYYCYEYDLDSTRGRKRILNVVTIAGSRLYIVNGQVKCPKAEGGEEEAEVDEGDDVAAAAAVRCERDGAVAAALTALRASAASFQVVT